MAKITTGTLDYDTDRWYKNVTITQQNGGYSMATKNTYVDKNIELIYNIPGIVLPKPTSGTNTFYVTVPNGSNGTVTFHFSVDTNGNTTIT